MNDSIIDVAGSGFRLPGYDLRKVESGVPAWPTKVVDTYKELEGATDEQRRFYYQFREAFRRAEYFDLEKEDSYALLLLLELFGRYDKNREIEVTLTHISELVARYPETRKQALLLTNERSLSGKINIPGEPLPIDSPAVTENSFVLIKYVDGVPIWEKMYIYTHKVLNDAADEQRVFYYRFREAFRQGQFLDLEGNMNYAFVLMFELIHKYTSHKSISRIDKELHALAACYPPTKRYWKNTLLVSMREAGDLQGMEWVQQLPQEAKTPEAEAPEAPADPGKTGRAAALGEKYREALELQLSEVNVINRFTNYSNGFFNIPFCQQQVLGLFAQVLRTVASDTVVTSVADVITNARFRYSPGSENYRYSVQSTIDEVYGSLLKRCENTVRDRYEHKRKITADIVYGNAEAEKFGSEKLTTGVEMLLTELGDRLPPPDEAAEMELNAQNTVRWKTALNKIFESGKTKPVTQFGEQVLHLAKVNSRNPSVENIFLDAAKFIAPTDAKTALSLYVHYVFQDAQSVKFDYKALPKSLHQYLFKTAESLAEFEKIIQTLIANKNLQEALAGVDELFVVKRKKILLNNLAIEQEEALYSRTVDLLNAYLQDPDDDIEPVVAATLVSAEKALQYNVDLSPQHITAMDFFVKNNYIVSEEDISSFTKRNNLFQSRLIDGLNEACYDALDDNLVEAEHENYIMNENYYQRLLTI